MRLRVALFLTLSAAGSLLCAGCGSEAAVNTTTIPVKGKITYKGQPLIRGSVIFEPDGAGKEGRAEIQPDGTYVLATYKADDGAVPGVHRVSIEGATGKTKSTRIPIKFGSVNTSKLEVEVNKDKSDYPFELQ
jgi:hypothetical protein